MSLPATDSFTGSNGSALSANWTAIDGGFDIQSNRANPTTDSGGNGAYWNADSFNANQKAKVTIYPSGSSQLTSVGPAVRLATGPAGYFANMRTDGVWELQRWNGDESYTVLQSVSGLTAADGDELELRIEGSSLTMFQNGTQRGTASSESTYASGAAGIFAYRFGTQSVLDDFNGDNLAAAVPTMGYLKPNRLRPRIFAPGLAR